MATDGSPFANADLVAEPEAASSEKGDTLRFCYVFIIESHI